MLTIREVIKTLYNALLQRLKKHRGNWEQNDPTADDYIKNRPFYTDETKTETVVKTKTFTAEGSYWWVSPFAFIPVVGKTYRVVFDGKEYICVGYADGSMKCIGNQSIGYDDNYGKDTGEPFLYYWWDSDDYGLCVRYAGKHTITIEKLEVVKIDQRYLPENNNAEVEAAIDDLYIYADNLDYAISNIPTDTVRYNNSQSLSASQKQIARNNIGAVSSDEITGVVKYNTAQSLTDAQKQQARTNIGALEDSDIEEKIAKIEEQIEQAKDHIALIDQINGYTYLVGMCDGDLVSYNGVKSIKITTMPDKTDYIYSEYFDPTGMVVTATCQDGTTKEITKYTCPTEYLTEDMTSVEIVYKEAGIPYKATVPVTVSAFDPATVLIDFTYTDNGDNTYTLTGWKGTLNGESSTEIIIPNCGCIIV